MDCHSADQPLSSSSRMAARARLPFICMAMHAHMPQKPWPVSQLHMAQAYGACMHIRAGVCRRTHPQPVCQHRLRDQLVLWHLGKQFVVRWLQQKPELIRLYDQRTTVSPEGFPQSTPNTVQ